MKGIKIMDISELNRLLDAEGVPQEKRRQVKELYNSFNEALTDPSNKDRSPAEVVHEIFKKFGMELNLRAGMIHFGSAFRRVLKEHLRLE